MVKMANSVFKPLEVHMSQTVLRLRPAPAPFLRGPALELGCPLPMCSSWRAISGPSFQKPSDPSPVTSACWLLLVLIGPLVFSSLLLTCLASSNSLLVGVLTSLSPSQQQSADLVLFLHG